MRGVGHQEKAVSEITTFGWVWPGKHHSQPDNSIL